MGRIALGLSYDGRGWQGWQTQPGGRTLQDALESALRRFLAAPAVATICAGRTDAGVHTLQQVVHLDTAAVRRDESWVRGLNALLPETLAVIVSGRVKLVADANASVNTDRGPGAAPGGPAGGTRIEVSR